MVKFEASLDAYACLSFLGLEAKARLPSAIFAAIVSLLHWLPAVHQAHVDKAVLDWWGKTRRLARRKNRHSIVTVEKLPVFQGSPFWFTEVLAFLFSRKLGSLHGTYSGLSVTSTVFGHEVYEASSKAAKSLERWAICDMAR